MIKFVWTEEKLDILRRQYPTTPAVDLMDILGCSDSTIHAKARSLGIKRNPSFKVGSYYGRYVKDKHKKKHNDTTVGI